MARGADPALHDAASTRAVKVSEGFGRGVRRRPVRYRRPGSPQHLRRPAV